MIVVDTSGLLALLDRGEPDHARCHQAVKGFRSPMLTIDLVLAETDFLVLTRLGAAAEAAFLAQLVAGVPRRESLRDTDLARAAQISKDYADQAFGLTDAAVMAVAERLGARVLTLDRRHFQVFRTSRGVALTLLP